MTVSRSGLCPSIPPCLYLSLPSSFLSPARPFASLCLPLISYSTLLSFLLPPPSLQSSSSNSYPSSLSFPYLYFPFFMYLHMCTWNSSTTASFPSSIYTSSLSFSFASLCLFLISYSTLLSFLSPPPSLQSSSSNSCPSLLSLPHFYLPSFICVHRIAVPFSASASCFPPLSMFLLFPLC